MFDHIATFCNPKRKHVKNGMLSPVGIAKQQKLQPRGVYEALGNFHNRIPCP